MIKTSIRFFDNVPVRSVWDEESSRWWLCAVDIIEALSLSNSPRIYWATIKRRNPELIAVCKQLKLTAKDGKKYLTDVIDDDGLNLLIAILPSKKSAVFLKWVKTKGTSIDEQSKETITVGKLSKEELNFQRDINYKDFLGEDILIVSSCAKRDGAKPMKLVEIIEPDYIDEYETLYKFVCNEHTVGLTKNEIYQFIPKKWLDDDNHEYYYVIFRYGKTDRSKEHIYISNDYSIKVGDRVLPFGNERTGNVVKTGFYKKSNAPYPVEKTWLISRKAYEEIDASKYEDFSTYIKEDNHYFKFLKNREGYKGYIANSLDTYKIFSWEYIDHVKKFMLPNDDGKINGESILDFLEEEFQVVYYYGEQQGKFLNRYNQLYSFFDSVWMSYLLAKNDYIEDGIIDIYKYMLCIYRNGGFDNYLLDASFDKKCLEEHISFINKHIDCEF